MFSETSQFAKACSKCAITTGVCRRVRPLLHPIPVGRPFQILRIDVMDLPLTDTGNRHVGMTAGQDVSSPAAAAAANQLPEPVADHPRGITDQPLEYDTQLLGKNCPDLCYGISRKRSSRAFSEHFPTGENLEMRAAVPHITAVGKQEVDRPCWTVTNSLHSAASRLSYQQNHNQPEGQPPHLRVHNGLVGNRETRKEIMTDRLRPSKLQRMPGRMDTQAGIMEEEIISQTEAAAEHHKRRQRIDRNLHQVVKPPH